MAYSHVSLKFLFSLSQKTGFWSSKLKEMALKERLTAEERGCCGFQNVNSMNYTRPDKLSNDWNGEQYITVNVHCFQCCKFGKILPFSLIQIATILHLRVSSQEPLIIGTNHRL